MQLKKGDQAKGEFDYSVPEVVPSGRYTGKLLMQDNQNNALVCYSFDMVFADPTDELQKNKNKNMRKN